MKGRRLRKKPKDCEGCPYCLGTPCIGWCTRKILQKEVSQNDGTDEGKSP